MQIQAGVIALAFLTATASALNEIKCYTCTSETSESCSDPINIEGADGQRAMQCTNEMTNKFLGGLNNAVKGLGDWLGLEKTPNLDVNFVCLKSSYTRTLADGKDKKYVIRSCGVEGSNFCQKLKENPNYSKDFFCEECKGDLCNGSTSIIATPIILLSTIALLFASR